jgi:hypothetical protein
MLAALAAAMPAAAQEGQQMPQMSAEEKAMMEAMEKAAKPGKQHQWLVSLAGTWDFTTRFYTDPAAPPAESKGWAERSVMLGGRVVAEAVHGDFMGNPFEGYGITGYDNVTGKYWGTWSDNMSTGLMTSTGSCDEQGTCTFTGSYADPMSGQMKTTKMVSKHTGDSEHHEFWETRDGKDVKTMELDYKRRK